MRARLTLCCLICLSIPDAAGAQGSATRAAASSCEKTRSEEVVATITARGELGLTSGRTVRLLDVRLPFDDDGFGRPLAWLQSLAGRRVAVARLASGGDRWGREAGDAALLGETAPIDLAELLVGEGFAMVDAGDRNALCRPELLLVEERARRARLGIWASARHAPVPAADVEQLQQLIGRFTVVEGVVRSVGERRERTYLNFGPEWQQDLTITIPKRTWAMLRARGLPALRGKRIRARGVLERWQGVAMEITAADMLEVLGQDITRP
jgi:hypothetical protein